MGQDTTPVDVEEVLRARIEEATRETLTQEMVAARADGNESLAQAIEETIDTYHYEAKPGLFDKEMPLDKVMESALEAGGSASVSHEILDDGRIKVHIRDLGDRGLSKVRAAISERGFEDIDNNRTADDAIFVLTPDQFMQILEEPRAERSIGKAVRAEVFSVREGLISNIEREAKLAARSHVSNIPEDETVEAEPVVPESPSAASEHAVVTQVLPDPAVVEAERLRAEQDAARVEAERAEAEAAARVEAERLAVEQAAADAAQAAAEAEARQAAIEEARVRAQASVNPAMQGGPMGAGSLNPYVAVAAVEQTAPAVTEVEPAAGDAPEEPEASAPREPMQQTVYPSEPEGGASGGVSGGIMLGGFQEPEAAAPVPEAKEQTVQQEEPNAPEAKTATVSTATTADASQPEQERESVVSNEWVSVAATMAMIEDVLGSFGTTNPAVAGNALETAGPQMSAMAPIAALLQAFAQMLGGPQPEQALQQQPAAPIMPPQGLEPPSPNMEAR